jgi:hypothetical protein
MLDSDDLPILPIGLAIGVVVILVVRAHHAGAVMQPAGVAGQPADDYHRLEQFSSGRSR